MQSLLAVNVSAVINFLPQLLSQLFHLLTRTSSEDVAMNAVRHVFVFDVLLSTAVLDRTFSLSSVVFLYILSYFVFHCQTGWLNIGLPLTNLSLIDYIASVPCIDTTLYV